MHEAVIEGGADIQMHSCFATLWQVMRASGATTKGHEAQNGGIDSRERISGLQIY